MDDNGIKYSKETKEEKRISDYNLQKWNKIEFINRKKNEFILSIPLYGRIGNYHNKQIMTADLQRLRNYHIRIESLENVTIPKGMKTGLKIKIIIENIKNKGIKKVYII